MRMSAQGENGGVRTIRRRHRKKNTNKEAYKLGGGIRITKMERYNSAVKVMLLYLKEWPAFAKREKSALDGGAKLTTLVLRLYR